jgi:glycine cleavage system H protein
MQFPDDLKYTDTHEWVRVDGAVATVGITAFAAGELGDVVFVDIPELKALARGDAFGSIEAVKTVSDLIAPISGTLTEKNAELEGAPDVVNSDPYGAGWMVKMSIADASELAGLMDAAQYAALIGKA